MFQNRRFCVPVVDELGTTDQNGYNKQKKLRYTELLLFAENGAYHCVVRRDTILP